MGGGDDRALVTSSGRVIGTSPDGWMPAEPLELPAYGGEFTLALRRARVRGAARRDGAFLVRRLEHAPAGSSGGAAQLRLLGDDRPRVIVDGDSVPLRPPAGRDPRAAVPAARRLTTEQLGREVYGDDASNSTVRGEVSRLRKLVGLAIETEPYRLAGHVESDSGACERCCCAARSRRRLSSTPGRCCRTPTRPASSASARARGLDAPRGDDGRRPRRAVGVGADALGPGRPGGWKQVLSALDFRDPRRSHAAAQVGRLRAAA